MSERSGRLVRLLILVVAVLVVLGTSFAYTQWNAGEAEADANRVRAELEDAMDRITHDEVVVAAGQALQGDYVAVDRLLPEEHLRVVEPAVGRLTAEYVLTDHNPHWCFEVVLDAEGNRITEDREC